MPVSWDYYIQRRGITTEQFIEANKCETYQDLVGSINRFDVEPPAEEQVKQHFVKPEPPPKPRRSKRPAQKKEVLGTKSKMASPPAAKSKPSPSRHQKIRAKKKEEKSE